LRRVAIDVPIARQPFELRAVLRLPHVHVEMRGGSGRVGNGGLIRLTGELRMIAVLVDEQDARPVRHPVNEEITGNRTNSG